MDKKSLLKHPVGLTEEMLKKYPDFYSLYKDVMIDKMKTGAAKDGITWPEWCQVPMNFAATYIGTRHPFGFTDIAALHVYASWNTEKIVLDVDEILYKELNTDDRIYQEIFYHLPFTCPYVSLPKNNRLKIDGFFVHMDRDVDKAQDELRFLLASGEKYIPIIVGLDPKRTIESATVSLIDRDILSGLLPARLSPKKAAHDHFNIARKLFPILIYLCSKEADIIERGAGEKRKRKDSSPKIYDVGAKIGAAIKEYRYAYDQESIPGTGTRAPHMRKAHWHSFWIGPKSGERHLIVKWLPPIPVGVSEGLSLSPTIRKIEKGKQTYWRKRNE